MIVGVAPPGGCNTNSGVFPIDLSDVDVAGVHVEQEPEDREVKQPAARKRGDSGAHRAACETASVSPLLGLVAGGGTGRQSLAILPPPVRAQYLDQATTARPYQCLGCQYHRPECRLGIGGEGGCCRRRRRGGRRLQKVMLSIANMTGGTQTHFECHVLLLEPILRLMGIGGRRCDDEAGCLHLVAGE